MYTIIIQILNKDQCNTWRMEYFSFNEIPAYSEQTLVVGRLEMKQKMSLNSYLNDYFTYTFILSVINGT